MQALFSLQLYYEKILTQESNLTIFKNAILWSTPSTPFHEAQHAREHAKHVKHAKHASTEARHFADSLSKCSTEFCPIPKDAAKVTWIPTLYFSDLENVTESDFIEELRKRFQVEDKTNCIRFIWWGIHYLGP